MYGYPLNFLPEYLARYVRVCTQVSTRLKCPGAFVKLFPPPVGTLCKPYVILFLPPVGKLCKPHSILFPPPVAMAKNHTLQQKCRVILYFVAVRAMHEISTHHPVRRALPRGDTTVPPRTVICYHIMRAAEENNARFCATQANRAHTYMHKIKYYTYCFPPPGGMFQASSFIKKTFIVRTYVYWRRRIPSYPLQC